jgi:hypothetical protein
LVGVEEQHIGDERVALLRKRVVTPDTGAAVLDHFVASILINFVSSILIEQSAQKYASLLGYKGFKFLFNNSYFNFCAVHIQLYVLTCHSYVHRRP